MKCKGPYKTASIAASPLLRPRRVNQKSAKIYFIFLLRLPQQKKAAVEEVFYCGLFSTAAAAFVAAAVILRRNRSSFIRPGNVIQPWWLGLLERPVKILVICRWRIESCCVHMMEKLLIKRNYILLISLQKCGAGVSLDSQKRWINSKQIYSSQPHTSNAKLRV